MDQKYGQSWIHRTFRFWNKALFVVIIVSFLVEGSSDICKQQEQSSFQLRKLSSSTKSNKNCAELCCKDAKCTIPLRVRKHCFGIACAKKELCQVVFEQLKEFQGHRVDKRDADDDEDDYAASNWEKDHGKALNIYQKREELLVNNSSAELTADGVAKSKFDQEFPAFLFTRERRGLLEEKAALENATNYGNASVFNGTSSNRFFIALNDSQDDSAEKVSILTKRASSDDDDDDDNDDNGDVDGDDVDDDDAAAQTSCSKDSEFHKSVIPKRSKNYHFKRLEKKSKSLSTCSKKCCKTDNCILSFMVEKTCLGVLCSGDGDCHKKKEKLPETHFELSTVKRDVNSNEDSTDENDEQKRSTIQTKYDDDVDGEVDNDEEDDGDKEEESKKKKHNKQHKKYSKHHKKSPSRRKTNHRNKKHRKKNTKMHHQKAVHKKKRHNLKKEKEEEDENDKDEDSSGSGKEDLSKQKFKTKKEKYNDMNEDSVSVKDERNDEIIEPERSKGDESNRKNEYTDDVRHLIYNRKPMNATLFDDAVVGSEKENADPDENESPDGREDAAQKSDVPEEHQESEEGLRLKNLEEEKAGRGDESMKMRESRVENDKRNDLMVEHRRYEDVEDRPRHSDETNEDDVMVRKHHQYKEKHYKNYWKEKKASKYQEEKPKGRRRKWFKDEPGKSSRHRSSYRESVREGEDEENGKSRDHYKDKDYYKSKEDYRNFGKSNSISKGEEDDRSGMDDNKDQEDRETSSGHPDERQYIRFHSKQMEREEEHRTTSHDHGEDDTSEASRKSYVHRSKEHVHKKNKESRGRQSKGKSKSSKMSKEERLIEKLEHLEEKIEKKQKTELQSRKEKILQKVEKLANKLEKKTTSKDNAKKDRKGEKEHKSKKKSKKSNKSSKSKERLAAAMEGSGENNGHVEPEPEKIVIPPKEKKHHKTSKKKSSKTNHQEEKKKHETQKKENFEISGEGSSMDYTRLHEDDKHGMHHEVKDSDGGKHSKHHDLEGSGGEGHAMQHHLEASGGGEDEDGVMAHYLGFERDHKVDDSNWSQRNVIVPYIEKKNHHHHHHQDGHMPVLNEDILDGLNKIRYEKKDVIAKPSKVEKEKLKGEIRKVHNFKDSLISKPSHEKSNKMPGHPSKKTHSKSKHKHQKMKKKFSKKKNNEKDKLMKEFEKYREFVKAQALGISGEGSGEGDVGSGREPVSKNKPAKKKSTHDHEKERKANKHEKKNKSSVKHKHGSKKKTKHKVHLDLTSSGNSEKVEGMEEGSGNHIVKVHDKKKSLDEKKKKHREGKGKISEKKGSVDAKKSKYDKKSSAGKTKMMLNSNHTNIIGDKKIEDSDKEPKMFHDRKETSAGEVGRRNQTASARAKTEEPSKNSSSSSSLEGNAMPNKQPLGAVISERNTTWHHEVSKLHGNVSVVIDGKSTDANKKHIKSSPTHPSVKAAEHKNKTTTVASTKGISTTIKLLTTRRPTVAVNVITTSAPKTTRATTMKKKVVPKTTKPVTAKKKAIVKKKPRKATTKPTRRLTTTGVPTLSILTGDEDVESDNVEPISSKNHEDQIPTRGHEQTKRKNARLTTAKKNANQNKHAKKIAKPSFDRNKMHRLFTTVNPQEWHPSPQVMASKPTPPVFNSRPKPQKMVGPGGSTGVLGDLQLPEPPGNGNIASGPPFYGQQGIPSRVPIQGPFGEMQYHKEQMGRPYVNGPSQTSNVGHQNAGTDLGHVQQGNTQQLVTTMKTFLSPGYGGVMPLQKPTSQPRVFVTATKPSAAPSQKQNHNHIPQSPQNVINRILGPHKASPIQVIQNILKPKQVPKNIHGQNGAMMAKPVPNQGPVKGKLAAGPGRINGIGQKQTKGKPSGKAPTAPHKKPSAIAKKPSNKVKPNNKGLVESMGKLNDFFKNADKVDAHKTTVKPLKATVPKPNIPRKKVPESAAPINPKGKQEHDTCPVRQNLQNMVLSKGRRSGEFTRMQGYPSLDTCIKQCCKAPTCDLLFKSGEVCYLVHCHSQESCKTEPLKEPTIRTRIVFLKKPGPKAQQAKPAVCQGESAFGITWKETKPDSFATRTCPREAKGMAKRQCNDHAQWLAPDFSGCVSDQYTNLNEDVKHLGFTSSVKNILSKLEEVTTQTIDNSLIFGGDIMKASNILDEVSKYVSRNHGEKFGFGALRNFARSASNLIDETNKQEWENVNHSLKGPGKIMKALENFGVICAGKIPPVSNNQPIVTNNLVMSVAHLSKVKKYVFPNYTLPYLKRWTTKRDQIILPSYLFNSGVVKVASVNYKTLAQLLPHQWSTANHVTFTDGFRVNSKVIATSIRPELSKKINPPVTVILHHLKEINSARTKCVHWDFNSNQQNGGSWSSDGCWVVTSNATVTVCQCEHLTHFAVLMNLSDEDRVSAKEQAKENTFALMWLGIPVLVVLSVGAMYTCFAWSKAPRRRPVVVKDGKPRLPEDEVIVTKTVKEDFPGSPNRYLYSSYTSPSPSDLEWEHVWDFLTNSEFENWQSDEALKRKRPRRRKLDLRPSRLLRSRKKKLKDKFETSEYFSEGDSSSTRWKHQDDNEWSRERIKCLGKGVIDISSEASQPVDSLEEFSDVTSVADSKDGDKCSSSFENFSPDAISSPHSGYGTESKYYSFVYRSNINLKEREQIHLLFNAESRLSANRKTMHSSCSSLETLHSLHPSRVQKTKYASTTCLVTIGQKSRTRFIDRKWSSKISLASSMRTVTSSGFLDKTWSSKYASSLSISTLTRSVSTKTINDDTDAFHSGCENNECEHVSSEQGYGTFESSGAFSNDIMDMNITSSDIGLGNDSINVSSNPISSNIPTYDMNLLTPSKRPLGVIEKPLESSSLDNSWMDDFNKDVENIESFLWSNSQASLRNETFVDLREEAKAILKETCIMNMDLVGSNSAVRDSTRNVDSPQKTYRNSKDSLGEISNQIITNAKLENLSAGSSMEDLGIDMCTEVSEISSTVEDSILDNNPESSLCIDTLVNAIEETSTEGEINTSMEESYTTKRMKDKKYRLRPKSASHLTRGVSIPRTSNIRKKTKVLKKKSERPTAVATGLMTRSPTKHMRSYIVLRQQSRYSEHERGSATEKQDSPLGNDKNVLKRVNKTNIKETDKDVKIMQKEQENYGDKSGNDCQTIQDDKEGACECASDMTLKDKSEAEEQITLCEFPGKAIRIEKSRVTFSADDAELTCDVVGEGEQIRRTVETSVFGSTLKRWKGRSRLYSLRNRDKDVIYKQ